MKRSWFAWLALLSVGGALAACSELTDPEPEVATESDLTFVRLSANAPAIADTVVSFWAVRGEERAVQIRYYYGDTHTYAKCLRFVVPAQALRQRADGTMIAQGDSVRITVRMPDTNRFVFVFDPSGLQFDPNHPARVEVMYRYADPDLNGDGVVDQRDESLRARFGFWRQERPGDPWYKVATSRLEDVTEAHANIDGFTIYALAID